MGNYSPGKRTYVLNELANFLFIIYVMLLTCLISLWIKWPFFKISHAYWHLFSQGKVFYHLNSLRSWAHLRGTKSDWTGKPRALVCGQALWGVPPAVCLSPGLKLGPGHTPLPTHLSCRLGCGGLSWVLTWDRHAILGMEMSSFPDALQGTSFQGHGAHCSRWH